jgi:hypothetical protein
VFVQVHNRGLNPATNVATKVFFANASVGLPDLPPGFWTGFPNNALPASSPWQEIAAHMAIPQIDGGRSQIVGFDWPVPATAADHTCLLVITSAGNDPLQTSVLNVGALVRGQKQCALKNVAVVNPPAAIGPRVLSVQLDLWRPGGGDGTFSLGLDRTPTGMLSGIVLSRRLSTLAAEQGLPQAAISAAHQAELARLLEQFPQLQQRLDLTTAYRGGRGVWLRSFPLEAQTPEPLVALVDPEPRVGQWSLLQYAADESVAGGFTLEAVSRGAG